MSYIQTIAQEEGKIRTTPKNSHSCLKTKMTTTKDNKRSSCNNIQDIENQ